MATFKDFSKAFAAIDRDVFSPNATKKLGERGADILYKRVKSGYGVSNDKKQFPKRDKLDGLEDSTIRQRRERGVSGKFGSPGRSNLTDTGQLLESFEVTGKQGQFNIDIPNTKRQKRGGEKKSRTNAEVAEHVSDNGRPFFALTKAEQQILAKEVKDTIRSKLRGLI